MLRIYAIEVFILVKFIKLAGVISNYLNYLLEKTKDFEINRKYHIITKSYAVVCIDKQHLFYSKNRNHPFL